MNTSERPPDDCVAEVSERGEVRIGVPLPTGTRVGGKHHTDRAVLSSLLGSPYYHLVVEEGVRTVLRDLNRRLRLGPVPVERCLDCGPGA
jgi:hypothetical protein